MIDILRTLFAAKRARSEADERAEPFGVVAERAAARRAERRPFAEALASASGTALVAEVKHASPSAGTIATAFDPEATARAYEAAGVDAISVLTEESQFLGDLRYLDVVRAATTKPILRKDFLSTPYEVVQSAAHGADAILLIVAMLDDFTLARLAAEARRVGLATLVEVHDADELRRALAIRPAVVGVNNRDLRDFTIDLATSERLVPEIPAHVVAIAESGIRTPEDVARVVRAGARGVLVGESLMRADDPAAFARRLKEVGATAPV